MVEVSNYTKGQEPQVITTAHIMFPFNENTAGLRDSHTTDRAIKPSFSNGSEIMNYTYPSKFSNFTLLYLQFEHSDTTSSRDKDSMYSLVSVYDLCYNPKSLSYRMSDVVKKNSKDLSQMKLDFSVDMSLTNVTLINVLYIHIT